MQGSSESDTANNTSCMDFLWGTLLPGQFCLICAQSGKFKHPVCFDMLEDY